MDKEHEKCFVYQCLTTVCHGADIENRKFSTVCLNCPCFQNWIKMRERRENTLNQRPKGSVMDNPCISCSLSKDEKVSCCRCPSRLEWEHKEKKMRSATKEEEEGITSYVRGISKGTGINLFSFL